MPVWQDTGSHTRAATTSRGNKVQSTLYVAVTTRLINPRAQVQALADVSEQSWGLKLVYNVHGHREG